MTEDRGYSLALLIFLLLICFPCGIVYYLCKRTNHRSFNERHPSYISRNRPRKVSDRQMEIEVWISLGFILSVLILFGIIALIKVIL
jgi:hypothetical protein